MYCKNCGAENNNTSRFCKECGASMDAATESNPGYQNTSATSDQPTTIIRGYAPPGAYKPISMWGYFGYELLFAIPLVGFICLIIFSVSSRNLNLKNFAKSYFCVYIVAIIVAVVGVLLMASGIITSGLLDL